MYQIEFAKSMSEAEMLRVEHPEHITRAEIANAVKMSFISISSPFISYFSQPVQQCEP